MPKKKKCKYTIDGSDQMMPDGTWLSEYSEKEFEVLQRWIAEEATIGDLNAAGPHTAKLAFIIARDVIMAIQEREVAA